MNKENMKISKKAILLLLGAIMGVGGIGATLGNSRSFLEADATSSTTSYTYQLVTSKDQLILGDTYAIVSSNGTNHYAMSAKQGNNARVGVQVSVDSSNNTFVMEDGASSVAAFNLSAGIEDGSYSFYCETGGTGYIYAGAPGTWSKNPLRTEASLTGNSSWNVTISSLGTASLVAQGSNANKNLKFYYEDAANTYFYSYEDGSSELPVSIFHATNVSNEGTANSWATSFLAESSKVCSFDKDLDDVGSLMNALSISELSTPSVDILKHATSENATGDLANALARYDHIVNKYTSCQDILARRANSSGNGLYIRDPSSEDISSLIMVILVGGAAIGAIGSFLYMKRKSLKKGK